MKLISLADIEKLPSEEQFKTKMDIIENNPLDEIPCGYLPPVHASEYYFVSYSHLDYQKVYRDIFLLEEEGLNIWYDRGMPAGKDWREVANRYIAPYSCKGILFFVSEHALMSNSIQGEMEYAKKMNKPSILVLLPFTEDYQHQGESVKGKIFPLKEMLEILRENGVGVGEEKEQFLMELFPPTNVYLRYDIPAMTKVEKIKACLPDIPVLRMDPHTDSGTNVIIGVNDIAVEKITLDDYTKYADPECSLEVGASAFANCRYLREFDIPTFIIRPYAFCGCVSLTRAVLAGGYVADGAFMGCENLVDIDIEKLGVISDFAFARCSSLRRVRIEARAIGHAAFEGCASLEEVLIGKETSRIESSAFDDCPKLRHIRVDEENEKFVSMDDVLVNKETGEIVAVPALVEFVRFRSPAQAIGKYAFADCSELRFVDFGESIATIGDDAFQNCISLKRVKLPANIELVGMGAFRGCKNLKEVEIDAKEVYNEAFQECEKLHRVYVGRHCETLGLSMFVGCPVIQFEVEQGESNHVLRDNILYELDVHSIVDGRGYDKEELVLPKGLLKIEKRAFEGNQSLRSITLPDSLEEIDYQAFAGCKNLAAIHLGKGLKQLEGCVFEGTAIESLSLPASLTHFQDSSFFGMEHLTCIEVDSKNPYHASFDGALYDKNLLDLCFYPHAKKGEPKFPSSILGLKQNCFSENPHITKLELPDSIAFIARGAFRGLIGVKELRIPDRVSELADFIFVGCEALTRVTLGKGVESINSFAFSGAPNLMDFLVDPHNARYTCEDGVLLNAYGDAIAFFPPARTGRYVLPSYIHAIGSFAFRGTKLSELRVEDPAVYLAPDALNDAEMTVYLPCKEKEAPQKYGESFARNFKGKFVFLDSIPL